MALNKNAVTYNGVEYNYIRILSFEKGDEDYILVHLRTYKDKSYREKEIRIRNFIKNYNTIMERYYDLRDKVNRDGYELTSDECVFMDDTNKLIEDHEQYMNCGSELYNATFDVFIHDAEIEELSYKGIYDALIKRDAFKNATEI